MATPKILLVFYSRTGNTRLFADALASELGADTEELHDGVDRSGLVGYVRSSLGAITHATRDLSALDHAPEGYDLVVVGGPIWNASVCVPVRSFLRDHANRLPRLAFFACYGGTGAHHTFRQMARVAKKEPIATFAVRERELASGDATGPASRFATELRAALRGGHVDLVRARAIGGPAGSHG